MCACICVCGCVGVLNDITTIMCHLMATNSSKAYVVCGCLPPLTNSLVASH